MGYLKLTLKCNNITGKWYFKIAKIILESKK